jgi:soluble lytic murein transglycosylase-like protein
MHKSKLTLCLILLSVVILILSSMSYERVSIESKRDKLTYGYYKDIVTNHEALLNAIYYAKEYGVDLSIILALAKAESGFDVNAINTKNMNGTIDRGFMMLNSKTFKHLKEQDFFNSEINIKNGVEFYFKCLKQANGNEIKSLCYYNAGKHGFENKYFDSDKIINYINLIIQTKMQFDKDINILYNNIRS